MATALTAIATKRDRDPETTWSVFAVTAHRPSCQPWVWPGPQAAGSEAPQRAPGAGRSHSTPVGRTVRRRLRPYAATDRRPNGEDRPNAHRVADHHLPTTFRGLRPPRPRRAPA